MNLLQTTYVKTLIYFLKKLNKIFIVNIQMNILTFKASLMINTYFRALIDRQECVCCSMQGNFDFVSDASGVHET